MSGRGSRRKLGRIIRRRRRGHLVRQELFRPITTDQNPKTNYWVSVSVRGRLPKTSPALTILNYRLTAIKFTKPATPSFLDRTITIIANPSQRKSYRRRVALNHR